MRITRIETIPVQVPIRPELVIWGSLGVHASSPFVLVKIHTSEGNTGLGEVSCTPVWSKRAGATFGSSPTTPGF